MKIDKKYSKLHLCASKDKTREIINHIFLRDVKGKPSACATDGRRLVVVPVELLDDEKNMFIRAATWVNAFKVKVLKIHENDTRTFRVKPTEVKCYGSVYGEHSIPEGSQLATYSQDEVYETYPNVEQVIPQHEVKFTITLDAKLLYEMQEAMGEKRVTLKMSGETDPIVVGSYDSEAFGVLMPIITM